jgi:hypothetical protein
MMLDSLRAEEKGRGDLLVGHALRRVQGYPRFLGGERLGGLWSAGARPGSGGCEFVGGTKHPGREVHFREGVVSGTQLSPRLDALTAAAQPGATQEMGSGGFKRVGRVGMGREGRLVRLHGGLVVVGGEPPTPCHQRPQPRWCCRRSDSGEPLGQGGGLVSSSDCDVGLDEVGSTPIGSPMDPTPPSAAMRASSSDTAAAGSERHNAQNAAVTAWWAAKLVVPARSVSNLARFSAVCASS